MSDLQKKVIVVTGAASGIGYQVARSALDRGATVIACDIAPNLAELFAHSATTTHTVDVADRAGIDAMILGVVEQHGRIDGLVAAAGIYRAGPLLDFAATDVDDLLRVNVVGTLVCAQAVAAAMIRTEVAGSIVTVSSVAARLATADNGVYAASKGAVESLTRALAVSLAPNGIRVNAVAPGPIETPQAAAALADPNYAAHMQERILLKRLGQPTDVAEAALFLCGSQSGWITGAVLAVDGGVTAAR